MSQFEELEGQDLEDLSAEESFLAQIKLREASVPESQVSAAEDKLFARLEGVPQGSGAPETEARPAAHARVIRLRSWRTWVSAAACVLVVVLAAWLDKNWISGKKTLDTTYGQIAQTTLPDGSEVTLNAHSSLTWRRKMREGEDREVWLKGEAYLHIAKKPQHERFIVHTDHFDVIVTGTHFDVASIENGDGVVLQEGSVTIRSVKGEEVRMQPGEQVQYRDGQLVRQSINPENVIAWTTLRVVFDNATLEDVLTMIRQHYGVKVRLDNTALLHSPVNGVMANDNLDVLLKALALMNNLTIQKEGDQYVIR